MYILHNEVYVYNQVKHWQEAYLKCTLYGHIYQAASDKHSQEKSKDFPTGEFSDDFIINFVFFF